MPSGIKYISLAEPSGYGLSAVAYVRGLVNAGVPVQWIPVRYKWGSIVPYLPGEPVPLLSVAHNDAALSDLPALLSTTSRPITYDTLVAHTVPECWPGLFEPGKRNVGYTTWEADAPPPHWVPLLNSADRICVPCNMNRDVFAAAGVLAPLHIVPHIRRHAWNEFNPSEIDALRTQLGIPGNHFIFYTINTWDPRKALPELLRAYVHAFMESDPVTLLLKTPQWGYGNPPFYQTEPTIALAQAVIDQVAEEIGRPPPSICLLPYELTGRGIDMLHELGDCYVSLSHGEGWGLGAFDAATRGTPVVMTGWGGQLDFLGPAWQYALPYRLASAPVWPTDQPSFWPSQRWAVASFTGAVSALQRVFTVPGDAADSTLQIQAAIADRFAEPVVTRQFLAALDA